jgi:CBS-domain-containing membrane protein
MAEHRISGVPVVDADQQVLGIVSEGDLIRQVESDASRQRGWWLRAIIADSNNAVEYIKSRGHKARQVMTANPITIGENEPLHKIAALLEKHHIKRVPVVRDGRLVGIVSRANLLQGFSATAPDTETMTSADDREIRDAILREINQHVGLPVGRINVIVTDGVVQLWGLVDTQEEKQAIQLAAENTPGTKRIENNLGQFPHGIGGY